MSGDLFPSRQRIAGRTFTDRTGFQIGWLTALRPCPRTARYWIWFCSQCRSEKRMAIRNVLSGGERVTCSRRCWLKAAEWFADPAGEARKRDAQIKSRALADHAAENTRKDAAVVMAAAEQAASGSVSEVA